MDNVTVLKHVCKASSGVHALNSGDYLSAATERRTTTSLQNTTKNQEGNDEMDRSSKLKFQDTKS